MGQGAAVWQGTWPLSGRFLVFKSYREDFVIRYRNCKKFQVSTESKTASPKLN